MKKIYDGEMLFLYDLINGYSVEEFVQEENNVEELQMIASDENIFFLLIREDGDESEVSYFGNDGKVITKMIKEEADALIFCDLLAKCINEDNVQNILNIQKDVCDFFNVENNIEINLRNSNIKNYSSIL